MREPPNRIRRHILPRRICIICSREPPALLLHMPVHARKRDDVLEALELAHNERAVSPWAGVGDLRVLVVGCGKGERGTYVEMVSSFLRWELSSFLYEIAELRLSSLEFTGFIAWCDPIGDFVRLLLNISTAPSDGGVASYHFSCRI